MAILKEHIKLLASEVMADTDAGGGQMTGVAIPDNQMGNIFPHISQLDTTYGRVRMRQVYPFILSPNADTYAGALLVIDRRPTDPKVDVLLFGTGVWGQTRADAKDAIERYVNSGPLGPWFVYDTQTVGESALQLFARAETPTPEVGDVLRLVEDEGLAGEYEQYVRVTAVASEMRTFTDTQGDFTRQIISLELSDQLRYTFHGATISRYDTSVPHARVRETRVADAARYYGCRPLASAASSGAMQVALDSIWGQIVPAARSETPVTDVQAGGIAASAHAFGGRSISLTEPAYTDFIPVSINNRAYSYVASLLPLPALGTVRVEYRALGKWYRISDDGTGSLTGAGSGTLRPDTGSLSITLAALPDVGSSIIIYWGVGVELLDRSGDTPDGPYLDIELAEIPVQDSVSLTWTSGGQTKTATDNSAGVLSGHGSGTVDYPRRRIKLYPGANLPDAGTQVSVSYQHGPALTAHYTDPARDGSGHVQVTLPVTPLTPKTVQAIWNTDAELYDLAESTSVVDTAPRPVTIDPHVTARDDGNGNLVTESGQTVGTVNYSTGQLDWIPDLTASYPQPQYAWLPVSESMDGSLLITRSRYQLSGMVYLPVSLIAPPDCDVDVTYRSGGTDSAATETFPAQLTIRLMPTRFETLVPDTLGFQLGSTTYLDDGMGRVYRGATLAGSVDYNRATVTLTDWAATGSSLTLQTLGAFRGRRTTTHVAGRTPGAPIQPGGFILSATARDGTLLNATVGLDGNINAAGISGEVSFEQGLFVVAFGDLVLDSSLTPADKAEPWYRPTDVDGTGHIWRPREVFPETVRFSAVVYAYLPLDATILGLDPVRLPSDGRVPLYRKGGVALIHHSADIAIPTPTLGQVIDCGRVRLASVELRDANDTLVAEADYTPNLDAGTVTLGSLGSYTAPLTLTHRVEDLLLIGDVQIDGTVTFTRSITHDYPADEALVSSALIAGDLWAHVDHIFEQSTWTGVWSDSLIGDAPVAQFNSAQYPIVVTNHGAISEDWMAQFQNTTTVRLVGKSVGQIFEGPISADIAPINPATGHPYLTLPAGGWGGGWPQGAILRCKTHGAGLPAWLIQSIQQGAWATGMDSFRLQIRGDIAP